MHLYFPHFLHGWILQACIILCNLHEVSRLCLWGAAQWEAAGSHWFVCRQCLAYSPQWRHPCCQHTVIFLWFLHLVTSSATSLPCQSFLIKSNLPHSFDHFGFVTHATAFTYRICNLGILFASCTLVFCTLLSGADSGLLTKYLTTILWPLALPKHFVFVLILFCNSTCICKTFYILSILQLSCICYTWPLVWNSNFLFCVILVFSFQSLHIHKNAPRSIHKSAPRSPSWSPL